MARPTGAAIVGGAGRRNRGESGAGRAPVPGRATETETGGAGRMGQRLKFATYVEIQSPPGGNHAELIEDIVRLAQHADQVGFGTFTILEHPFHEKFALNPNPLALFCTLAQKTRDIRFRTLCHTLPLHNPMVLAGEIAAADILTGGRIECGVGRGHAWLCKEANIVMEESVPRFLEALEILQLAWTRDRFTYEGKYYTCRDLQVVPKPKQKPHPPLFIVGTSSKWFKVAAEKGWGTNIGGPAPDFVFKEAAEIYQSECRKAGTEPHMGYGKGVFLAEDENTAMNEARQWVRNFIDFNISPMDTLARNTPDEKKRLVDAGYAFYAADDFPKLRDLTFEQLVENDIVYVGTPKKVTQKFLDLYDRFHYQELVIVPHYGGMPRWQAIRNQELFARQIKPVLSAEIDGGARQAAE